MADPNDSEQPAAAPPPPPPPGGPASPSLPAPRPAAPLPPTIPSIPSGPAAPVAPVFTLPATPATPPTVSLATPLHAVATQAIPQQQKPKPKRGFGVPLVFALLLIAAGGVAVASPLGDRFRDSGPPEPTMLSLPMTTTTVPTTALAQVELITTTTIDFEAMPIVLQEVETAFPDDVLARIEECRHEADIVFVSLQAFVFQTGAHPEHPDGLAGTKWLEEHPDGWNSRWAFEYSDEGIRVVPTVGGSCDFGG